MIDPRTIADILAIDGPAGAGKSTVARRAAGALGFAFLDSGAMYRAATWNAMHRGVAWDDADALASATRAMQLELIEDADGARVLVDGQDVSRDIRTPEVTRHIARLDHNPEVRAHLVELQRAFGARGRTVAEGRDMGTVVFPNAKCKVYLDASIDERARRRALEFEAKGVAFDASTLREDIRVRDEKDMTRDVAPLRRADDAVLLDTSRMTTDDVVAAIVALARERW
ncbi:MAG: (d)CMP kinase [Candidatus Hydrogenedentes bacterium]|nr:(d)CMP kinase [Candidatus Hydrogenedentota bacterium]